VGIKDLVASPNEVQARPERRFVIIGTFFLVLLVLLVYRLFSLQVLQYHSSVTAVDSNSLHATPIPATRGVITDRTGNIMVGNLTTEVIELSRQSAAADPSVVGSLALLTHQSVATIETDLNNVQYSPYEPAPVYQNAPQTMIEFIRLHPGEFPGVTAVEVSRRTDPYGGGTGAQILGYVTPITGAEISANPKAGYTTSSVYGQAGIENFYESYLRGVPGQRTVEVNAYGNIIGSTQVSAPRTGDTVVLNIDAPLQKALDSYLSNDIKLVRSAPDPTTGIVPAAINGAAVVMDVRTGAVLAMSSYPSYNLYDFANGLSQATYNTLQNEGAFYDYPLQGLYTPGSTFKLITATAMMQTGIFSPYTIFSDTTGYYKVPGCVGSPAGCIFHDDLGQGGGQIDLQGALTVSSDAYFYNLGYLFWSQQGKYGETPIQNVAHQYGLDQLTNIDLPGEFAGRVDSPIVRLQLHKANPTAFPNYHWYTGDNLEMAFGQGATVVTPLELATAYATFANGGTRYAPQVAAAIVSPSGRVVVRYQPRVLGHVSLPPAVRDPILAGLEGVVQNPSGTAYGTFQRYATFSQSQFPVAGKTGTASLNKSLEPNSLFVGFAPSNNPEYVVACVIAQGGYGSAASAPVVAEAFSWIYHHGIPSLNLAPRSQFVTPTTHPSTTSTTLKGTSTTTARG
jgi:penicillin-binding protein 2